MNKLASSNKLHLAGAAYGFTLSMLGVAIAGAGHGTYLGLNIASAPLNYFGVAVSIIAPTFLWGVVGRLLFHSYKPKQKKFVLVILTLHYLSVMVIIFSEAIQGNKYFTSAMRSHPLLLLCAGILYLAGQTIALLVLFKFIPKNRQSGTTHR